MHQQEQLQMVHSSPVNKRLQLGAEGQQLVAFTTNTMKTADTTTKSRARVHHQQLSEQQQQPASSTTAASQSLSVTTNFDSLEEVATRLFMHRARDLTRTDALTQTEKLATEQCTALAATAASLHNLRSKHEATVECQLQSLAHRKSRLAEVEDLVAAVCEGQSQLQRMGSVSAELYTVAKTFVDETSQSDVVLNAATRVMRYAPRRRDMGTIVIELHKRVEVLGEVARRLVFFTPSLSFALRVATIIPTNNTSQRRKTNANYHHSARREGGAFVGDDTYSTPFLLSLIIPSSGATTSSLSADVSRESEEGLAQTVLSWASPSAALVYPSFIDGRAKTAEGRVLEKVLVRTGLSSRASQQQQEEGLDVCIEGLVETLLLEPTNTNSNYSDASNQSKDGTENQKDEQKEENGGKEETAPSMVTSCSVVAAGVARVSGVFDRFLQSVETAMEACSRVLLPTSSTSSSSSVFPPPNTSPKKDPSSPVSSSHHNPTLLLTAQRALLMINKERMLSLAEAIKAKKKLIISLSEEQTHEKTLREGPLKEVTSVLEAEESHLEHQKELIKTLESEFAAAIFQLNEEESRLAAAADSKTQQEAFIEELSAVSKSKTEEISRVQKERSDTEQSLTSMLEAEKIALSTLSERQRALRDDVAFLSKALLESESVYGQLQQDELTIEGNVLSTLLKKVSTVSTQDRVALEEALSDSVQTKSVSMAKEGKGKGEEEHNEEGKIIPPVSPLISSSISSLSYSYFGASALSGDAPSAGGAGLGSINTKEDKDGNDDHDYEEEWVRCAMERLTIPSHVADMIVTIMRTQRTKNRQQNNSKNTAGGGNAEEEEYSEDDAEEEEEEGDHAAVEQVGENDNAFNNEVQKDTGKEAKKEHHENNREEDSPLFADEPINGEDDDNAGDNRIAEAAAASTRSMVSAAAVQSKKAHKRKIMRRRCVVSPLLASSSSDGPAADPSLLFDTTQFFFSSSSADLAALTSVNVETLAETTLLHIDGLAAAMASKKTHLMANCEGIIAEAEAARRRFAGKYPNYARTLDDDAQLPVAMNS